MRFGYAVLLWALVGVYLVNENTATAQFGGGRATAVVQSDSELVVRAYPVGDILVTAPDYPYPGGEAIPTVQPLRSPATFRDKPAGGMMGMGGMGGGMMGGGMGGMGGGGGGGGTGMGGGMFQIAPEDVTETTSNSSTQSDSSDTHSDQSMGFQKSPAGNPPLPTGTPTMGELVKAITTFVEPSTWSEVGGEGSITPFGSLLLVAQRPAVHQQIEKFLGMIRAEGGVGRSVLVEAAWLLLDSAQLNDLIASGGASPEAGGAVAVDPAALEETVRKVPSYRGQITCFNRQTVHMISGNRRLVATSAIPIAGGGVGYQPIVAFPNLGVLLQVTPSLMPDNAGVILDAHSIVTQWQEPGKPLVIGADSPAVPANEAEGSAASPAGHATTELDRVDILTQQLETSLRIALGKPVLVGGLTEKPDVPNGEPPHERKQLYLFVRVAIPEMPQPAVAGKAKQK